MMMMVMMNDDEKNINDETEFFVLLFLTRLLKMHTKIK
jgi:hypothetical protein